MPFFMKHHEKCRTLEFGSSTSSSLSLISVFFCNEKCGNPSSYFLNLISAICHTHHLSRSLSLPLFSGTATPSRSLSHSHSHNALTQDGVSTAEHAQSMISVINGLNTGNTNTNSNNPSANANTNTNGGGMTSPNSRPLSRGGIHVPNSSSSMKNLHSHVSSALSVTANSSSSSSSSSSAGVSTAPAGGAMSYTATSVLLPASSASSNFYHYDDDSKLLPVLRPHSSENSRAGSAVGVRPSASAASLFGSQSMSAASSSNQVCVVAVDRENETKLWQWIGRSTRPLSPLNTAQYSVANFSSFI